MKQPIVGASCVKDPIQRNRQCRPSAMRDASFARSQRYDCVNWI